MSGSFRTNQFLILVFKILVSIVVITLSFSLNAMDNEQAVLMSVDSRSTEITIME